MFWTLGLSHVWNGCRPLGLRIGLLDFRMSGNGRRPLGLSHVWERTSPSWTFAWLGTDVGLLDFRMSGNERWRKFKFEFDLQGFPMVLIYV